MSLFKTALGVFFATTVSFFCATYAMDVFQEDLSKLNKDNVFGALNDLDWAKPIIDAENSFGRVPLVEIKKFLQDIYEDKSDFIAISIATGNAYEQIIPEWLTKLATEFKEKKFKNYAIDPYILTKKPSDEFDKKRIIKLQEKLSAFTKTDNLYTKENLSISLFPTFFPGFPTIIKTVNYKTECFNLLESILQKKLTVGSIIFLFDWSTPGNPTRFEFLLGQLYETLRHECPDKKNNLRFFVGRASLFDPEDTPAGLEGFPRDVYKFNLDYVLDYVWGRSEINFEEIKYCEQLLNINKNVILLHPKDSLGLPIASVNIDPNMWIVKGFSIFQVDNNVIAKWRNHMNHISKVKLGSLGSQLGKLKDKKYLKVDQSDAVHILDAKDQHKHQSNDIQQKLNILKVQLHNLKFELQLLHDKLRILHDKLRKALQ